MLFRPVGDAKRHGISSRSALSVPFPVSLRRFGTGLSQQRPPLHTDDSSKPITWQANEKKNYSDISQLQAGKQRLQVAAASRGAAVDGPSSARERAPHRRAALRTRKPNDA